LGGLWFEVSLGQKNPSQPTKLGMMVHTCRPSYVEGIGMRTAVQAGPRINLGFYLKINYSKKGLVERLKC
jgi:hypothetical protein